MLHKIQQFDREKAPAILRRFCPTYRVKSVGDIVPDDLMAAGIKGILLDLDNTLLPWKGIELPLETTAWIERCREVGLKLCLVSNTRNLARLKTISSRLDVQVVPPGRMKPAKEGFRRALDALELSAAEVVMVGDQMFTDVWGGNRMGICTIMVDRVHSREFIGTKVSRLLERFVLRLIGRGK
jgi:HAD superfamily phosphatase (TIGR01668 family)